MKIRHIWSILCKESIINQDDNLVSIISALEELNVDISPIGSNKEIPENISIPLNYEVVSMWFREDKEENFSAEIEFNLLDPKGKVLSSLVQPIEFKINVRRFRSRTKISGFPITSEGDYLIRIRLKEEGEKSFSEVASLPIEVKLKYTSSKN